MNSANGKQQERFQTMGKLKEITLEVKDAVNLGANEAWDKVLEFAEQAKEDAINDITNELSKIADTYELTLDDLDVLFEENHEDIIQEALDDVWEIY